MNTVTRNELSMDEITELLSEPKRKSLTTIRYEEPIAPGGFVGRVGSVRRSRKGRARRLPNGSRNYVMSEAQVEHYITNGGLFK